MNINELAKEVHENAVTLGRWDRPPALPECLCMIHAELSQALQEYQEGNPLIYGTCALSAEDCKFSSICDNVGDPGVEGSLSGPCRPEGIAVELADVILQTLDVMAALGVDVDAVVMAKHKYDLSRGKAQDGEE